MAVRLNAKVANDAQRRGRRLALGASSTHILPLRPPRSLGDLCVKPSDAYVSTIGEIR